MAQVITDDRTREVRSVVPANGKFFTLPEMQELVEGYIEILGLSNGQFLVINEEGKFNQQQFHQNTTATALARAAGIALHDYVVGPAVLASAAEIGES